MSEAEPGDSIMCLIVDLGTDNLPGQQAGVPAETIATGRLSSRRP
jgi:hypothetical protein